MSNPQRDVPTSNVAIQVSEIRDNCAQLSGELDALNEQLSSIINPAAPTPTPLTASDAPKSEASMSPLAEQLQAITYVLVAHISYLKNIRSQLDVS